MYVKSFEVTSVKVCIELEDGILFRILEADNKAENDNFKPQLFEKLNEREGIINTNYNGHFGNYIYLEVNKELSEANYFLSTIDSLIDTHLMQWEEN